MRRVVAGLVAAGLLALLVDVGTTRRGQCDRFTFGLDPKAFLPVGPWAQIPSVGHGGHTLLILGGNTDCLPG